MSEAQSTVRRVDGAFDALVLGLALWTVCTHATVAGGGSLDTLMGVAAFAFPVAIGAAWFLRRRNGDAGERGPPDEGAEPVAREAPWARLAVAALAAGSGLGVLLEAPLVWVWSLAAAAAGLACFREGARLHSGGAESASAPSPATRRSIALLFALSGACALLVLCAQRPDADDSFYLNLAVAAVDAPDAALLAHDTLHRVPEVPLPLPVYRVHALEPLVATIARLSGRPVLDVAHLFLPFSFAIFVPFVYARALRRLTPRAWPAATALCLGFLLFSAAASHGWASFGVLRLHQGKGVLLTLLLPATVAYALELAREARPGAWLRLAAVQVAAVGVSASALWLAPGVALAAAIAGLRPGREGPRRLALCLSTSLYVLVVAWSVRAETIAAFRDAPIPSPEMALGSLRLFQQALRAVFTPGLSGALLVFLAVGTWALARQPSARRLCAFSALLTLVLWNPFVADEVAAHLTSAATYWRVLWLLPMPIAFAVALTAPMEWRLGAGRLATAALAVVFFAGAVAITPRALAVSSANQVRLGPPGWKVPASEFEMAEQLARATSRDQTVLAPRLVAPWITTLHDHPIPLVVRAEYLPVLHERLGPDELQRRMLLMRLVSGVREGPRAGAVLREALEGELEALVVARSAIRGPLLLRALRETGFQKIHENADYELWRRSQPRTPGGAL